MFRNQGWALDGIHVVKYEIVNNAKEAEAFYPKVPLMKDMKSKYFVIQMVNINQDDSTLKENDFYERNYNQIKGHCSICI